MRDPLSVFRDTARAVERAGKTNALALDAAISTVGSARHVWVSGIGKSGLVARKCAGTLSSLGRSASFLHPVEALHGDAGGVREGDVLVAVSQSGRTAEVLRLVHELRLPVVSVSTVPSPLATLAAVALDSSVEVEAGGTIPVTAFAVAALLLDAVALGVGGELRHPGGYIGAMARPVRDYMLPPPRVDGARLVRDVIPELGHGAVLVDDGGIFTDGDLRRAAGRGELDRPVGEVCTRTPVTVDADAPARVALERMERRASQIAVLPVVEGDRVVGIVRLHDLVRAGMG